MTEEEEEIYRQMLVGHSHRPGGHTGRMYARTERPLTAKKIYVGNTEVVRLWIVFLCRGCRREKLPSLARHDVAMIPAVHARNLRNKNLACIVKFER